MKALAMLALAALTACGGGGGGSGGGFAVVAAPQPEPVTSTVVPSAPAKVCTVALWGDSILWGYIPGGRLSPSPADRLRQRGWTVTDHSQNGAFAALHEALLLQDPMPERFVVLDYGMNDQGTGQAYEAPMRSMLERIKAVGRRAVITGISHSKPDGDRREAYDATAKRLAVEYGALFAAWGDEPVVEADLADNLHPLAELSARLTRRIADQIEAAAPECRP